MAFYTCTGCGTEYKREAFYTYTSSTGERRRRKRCRFCTSAKSLEAIYKRRGKKQYED